MNEEELKLPNEWFEYLPEPYRTQALANADNDLINDDPVEFRECVCGGFTWSITPEGWDYWNEVSKKVMAGIIQKVEPKYKTVVTNFLEGVEL